MERTFVKSSQIRSVGYEPSSKTLEVEFHGGGIYQYNNVPSEKHSSLVGAPSAGTYFHSQIKGKHPHKKV